MQEKQEEKMVTIFVNPRETDGGLWTNEKLIVGEYTCSENEANDIRRRLEEYAEVKAKMNDIDGRVHIREKNKDNIIARFCADPREQNPKQFSYELGTLHPLDWEAQTPAFRDWLKNYRKNMYGR